MLSRCAPLARRFGREFERLWRAFGPEGASEAGGERRATEEEEEREVGGDLRVLFFPEPEGRRGAHLALLLAELRAATASLDVAMFTFTHDQLAGARPCLAARAHATSAPRPLPAPTTTATSLSPPPASVPQASSSPRTRAACWCACSPTAGRPSVPARTQCDCARLACRCGRPSSRDLARASFDLDLALTRLAAYPFCNVVCGMQVRLDASFYAFHHKFCVVDGRTLLNGSFNWTAQAASGNQESLVLFRAAPELAASFAAQFDRMWTQFAPKEASASG